MAYQREWKLIAARIRGLTQAAELHALYLGVRANDGYGRARRLGEHAASVLSSLSAFGNRFQHSLPPSASVTIKSFVASTEPLLARDTGETQDTKQEKTWAALVALGAIETELTYLLADEQDHIRSRAERAFVHLQRLIVVDPQTQAAWRVAFTAGEVECEKRGAVQLLHHGIWAFKANAAGGRTDLVFQEPSGDLEAEQKFVDGIVLTEWKVATKDNFEQQYVAARAQARRYAAGVLAGAELTRYRYAVVVSDRQVSVPADLSEGAVVYRHINIAVDPDVPSRQQRTT